VCVCLSFDERHETKARKREMLVFLCRMEETFFSVFVGGWMDGICKGCVVLIVSLKHFNFETLHTI